MFTELARGPEPFEALRARLGLHPRSARDFLDTLVALGFLSRTGDRYANTPETDLFLDRNKPSYVGGVLQMANARLYPFWAHLAEGLRPGLPQNEVKTGGADCAGWMKSAGFSATRVEPLVGPDSMVIGIK